ncbi:hypothetical protein BRD15_01960 [Halobacteriales archaeon SW_6_65_15]|jgi:hypothetical protein|nr:MAG: hypothetical protein BRD15_01960 [Halobacteriales archaeon SW_6_65_15]
MEHVRIRAGECVISEEAIRIDEGVKQFVRQQYEDRPLLVGGLLLIWILATVATLSLAGSLFVLDALPDYWFELLMASIALQATVPLASFLLAMQWTLSMRLAQRRGEYPRNLSDDDVIPVESVESIAFDTVRGYPVAFVRRRGGDEGAVRPIFFGRDKETEVERARAAFRSLGVSVESPRATASGS